MQRTAPRFLALLCELAAWPKPGLVSRVDSGSHQDMDAAIMKASANSLRPFFAELATAGQDGADMARLRAIGLRAEAAMLAVTGGINTHRGVIFGIGLLCAAAGEVTAMSAEGAAVARSRLGERVMRRWGAEIARGPIPLFGHGTVALRRYGAGGARAEAAGGFRSVYEDELARTASGTRVAAQRRRRSACARVLRADCSGRRHEPSSSRRR